MQVRSLSVVNFALLATVLLPPATGFAVGLPTCAQLASNAAYGLAGNVFITATTSDNQGLASPTAVIVPATATNAAYCKVHLQFSSQSGAAHGYAEGESQTIGINIGLPLNSTDGGSPTNPKGYSWTAVNGAWNGKVENLGGGGLVGSISATVTTPATNAGYVGSFADGGHNSTQANNGAFAVIQATNQLDVGKIKDFASESYHQQYLWALALAKNYYGQAAARNYWNGCSTGGRQGLELAQRWGEDFDGFLVGAPVIYYNTFQLAKAWNALVDRDEVVGAGRSTITMGQYNNAVSHAVAACDVLGTDVVADGVVDDPRQCTYSAAADPTILAAPAGTCSGANCMDLVQAKAIEKMWDGASLHGGPHNHFQKKLYYGWMMSVSSPSAGVGPKIPTGSTLPGMTYDWDHRDLTADVENMYSTRELAAANPLGKPNPIAIEDEVQLNQSPSGPGQYFGTDYQGIVDHVFKGRKRGKIIQWSGGNDALVWMQGEIHWYRAMATTFGDGDADYKGVSSWYRYYHAPGVGHCGGGVGADPSATIAPDGQARMFTDLVNWVENGIEPGSAGDSTHKGILATGPGTFGTRPICPYPTTAIYNGTGSTAVASSYHCGGNLDTRTTLCHLPITKFGRATSNELDYKELGLAPGYCEGDHDHDDDGHHAGDDDHSKRDDHS
jgi:Tannase and feruloyl esterase